MEQIQNPRLVDSQLILLKSVRSEPDWLDLTKSVASFHTPGLHGKNIQTTMCVLGGKSRVKDVTLFLTPSFRLNS